MDIALKLLLLYSVFIHTKSLGCKDQENNPVEWFMVYKIPILRHNKNLINDGLAYIYMTSKDETWKLSDISINSTKSIIGNTLATLYEDQAKLSYILYNDAPPNLKSSTKGHTKGAVIADKDEGFWLVHSVPHFPELEIYKYPKSGTYFGQTFFCISMDLDNLNKVGLQLQYNQPHIYAQNILLEMKTLVPDLTSAANNITVTTAPWYHINVLKSKNDSQFLSFAKSGKFKKELYVDLVAPYLECDLDVETWPHGPERFKSNCTQQFKVNNVKSIKMGIANASFNTTKDHSKWAVSSTTSDKFWCCIGDINRAEEQTLRGGGTVCINNKNVFNSFKNLINSIEDC